MICCSSSKVQWTFTSNRLNETRPWPRVLEGMCSSEGRRSWGLFRKRVQRSKIRLENNLPTAVCALRYIHVIPITEGVSGNSMQYPSEREGLNPLGGKKRAERFSNIEEQNNMQAGGFCVACTRRRAPSCPQRSMLRSWLETRSSWTIKGAKSERAQARLCWL